MMLIGLLIVFAVSIFIAWVGMQPDRFEVSRTAIVDAAPEAVYRQINDFHNWERWSPWARIDPAAKSEYGGSPLGAGASFAWSSANRSVGTGQMRIVESSQNERIRIKLEFEKPMKGVNDVQFDLKPIDDERRTQVTWSMSGQHNFTGKAMSRLMNMDKMVGGMFEQGLANLDEALKGQAIAAK